MGQKPPADLDREAKKKWNELVDSIDPQVDTELLANYCRSFSALMAIRTERATQLKAGTYETLTRGRDGAKVLNPLQVAENRMVRSLNTMLRTLGLAPSRETQKSRQPVADADKIDLLEAALCGPFGIQEIKTWREVRRGKVNSPVTQAELSEWKSDQAEVERRMVAWKEAMGIYDDGTDDAFIAALVVHASAEEQKAQMEAYRARDTKLRTALSRAGLDPQKQY